MKTIYITCICIVKIVTFYWQNISGSAGVESAAVVGEERDQLAVTGDGVDAVDLTRRLRKKMGHAELLSVGDANSEQPSPVAAADTPVVGVVAPPYYAFPHVRHREVKEPACYSPCSILWSNNIPKLFTEFIYLPSNLILSIVTINVIYD